MTDAASTENPFWDFSLALYDREGVRDACLALQDEAGTDINLLLFFCWVAASGRGRLTRVEVQTAMAAVAVWRVQVLLPLRRVRNRLRKDGPSDEARLRADLLKMELEAERIEQNRLFTNLKREPGVLETSAEARRTDAAHNCELYFDELSVALGDGLDDALATLLDAATRD